jgi:hypothetical protein
MRLLVLALASLASLALTLGSTLADAAAAGPPVGAPAASAPGAPASPPPVTPVGQAAVGMLGMDGANAPAEMGPAVTAALRRAIAKFPSLHIEMKEQDPAEVKLVFGCTDERPDCMAKVGKSLSVGHLIYGSLKKQPGSGVYSVTLKQLNVADATVEKFVSETVPAGVLTAGNPELDAMVEKWLRGMLLEGQRGGLRVQSEPPGATVQVDGATMGTTPLTLSDLEAGSHVVRLEMFGHVAREHAVTIRGGMVHDVTVQLIPVHTAQPPAVSRTTSSGGVSRGLRYTSYVFYGLTAVSALAAIGTWRSYLGNEDVANAHLDQLQTDLRAAGSLSSYNDFFSSSAKLSSCNGPAALNMYSSYQGYLSECHSGNTMASAATGLWITTGALAAVGITTTILSAVLKRNETKPAADQGQGAPPAASGSPALEVTPPPPPPAAPKLEGVAPVVSPTGGGAVMLFSF